MGNVNVTGKELERLKEMAIEDEVNPSTENRQIINRAWRARKGFKNESEVVSNEGGE